jgi:UDP-N-acetylglucosamine diphosphorylase / glucose-1-phosphate thymidylyltransferase / UDP-N-acetylgalactosamine diphosphorylase / glucosamine-1-phosphate N-acetyltransferase / galactosamine-1-phosphate N-acetyltransferase
VSALTAVVMAAGEGQRLRPLTERWPKPLLPIDGRPVLATLLRELAAADLRNVVLVTGHLSSSVERFAGDGGPFGLEIRYARQPEPVGSVDAVRRALAAGAAPPLAVLAADTVFRRGDLARAASQWLESGARGGLGVRRGRGREKTPVAVSDGRVAAIGRSNGGELTAAPLWFLDRALTEQLEEVPGPPFELASAFEAALEAGDQILAIELGPTRDLTHPADVVVHNFPYLSDTGETRFLP